MQKHARDIWQSYRALPPWVQIWVAFVLVPVNLGGLLFLDTHEGRITTALCIGGMAPNLVIVWLQRGFSKAMAFPHLPIWTPLVIWLGWLLLSAPPQGALRAYLVMVLIVDAISLGFDYPDAIKYLRGDRSVPRPAPH